MKGQGKRGRQAPKSQQSLLTSLLVVCQCHHSSRLSSLLIIVSYKILMGSVSWSRLGVGLEECACEVPVYLEWVQICCVHVGCWMLQFRQYCPCHVWVVCVMTPGVNQYLCPCSFCLRSHANAHLPSPSQHVLRRTGRSFTGAVCNHPYCTNDKYLLIPATDLVY